MVRTLANALNVLIVDDSEVNKRVLLKQMELLGYSAVGTSNGKKAVTACEETFFDLIFMDCSMPVLNGYQATAAIRAAQQQHQQKSIIIGLTARAMPGDRQLCLDAGMDDYLAKPVYGKDLRQVIEKWFSSAETSSSLSA